MSAFVLDCSVTMGWCFEDQADAYTEEVLQSFSRTSAVVPELWSYEVANVLLASERKKKIVAADSAEFLDLLNGLPISVAEEKGERWGERILSLGRSHLLSAYDAAYLHLAVSRHLPLATKDEALRRACKKVGVKIYRP